MITDEGCLVVRPGEGIDVRGLSGAPTLLIADGAGTQGLAAVFEQATPPHSGPTPHVHHDSAEMFYVVEGNYEFTAGDRHFDAPPGTFAFVPKGIAHTYRNAGDLPARLLYWFIPPAHMAEYFTALAQLPSGADSSRVDAIARDHGVEIVRDR